MILGFVLFVGGLLQSALAVWSIMTDASKDHISNIEAAVVKATNSEPLPKGRLGLAFDRVAQWIMLILGLFLSIVGFLLLFGEFS